MNKETKSFLLKSGILCLLIIGIFFLWKLLVNLGFKYRIRFPLLYNIGSFLLVTLLFYVYSRKKIAHTPLSKFKSNIKINLLFGAVSVFCFASFFRTMFFGDPVLMQSHYLFYGFLLHFQFLLGFVMLFIAFFGAGFFRIFFKEMMMILFVLFDFIIITAIIVSNWKFFSVILVKLVYFVLSIFSKTADAFFVQGIPYLSLKSFSVAVGASCSGVESLSMFILVGIFIFMLDWGKINKKRSWILIPGILGMFFMSVLRISILMWVGTFNPALSLGLFHTNIGWLLFAVYLLLFWYFAYPYLIKSHSKAIQKQ